MQQHPSYYLYDGNDGNDGDVSNFVKYVRALAMLRINNERDPEMMRLFDAIYSVELVEDFVDRLVDYEPNMPNNRVLAYAIADVVSLISDVKIRADPWRCGALANRAFGLCHLETSAYDAQRPLHELERVVYVISKIQFSMEDRDDRAAFLRSQILNLAKLRYIRDKCHHNPFAQRIAQLSGRVYSELALENMNWAYGLPFDAPLLVGTMWLHVACDRCVEQARALVDDDDNGPILGYVNAIRDLWAAQDLQDDEAEEHLRDLEKHIGKDIRHWC